MTISNLKTTTRAAFAALIIGAAAVSAVPAQAANNGVTFGFSFGSNGSTVYSTQNHQTRSATTVHHRRWNSQELSNRDIRRGLRDYGFRNIKFANRDNRRVRVTAVRDGYKYKLRVNRRNGNIKILDQRRLQGRGGGRHHRGGFQLEFNFR